MQRVTIDLIGLSDDPYSAEDNEMFVLLEKVTGLMEDGTMTGHITSTKFDRMEVEWELISY
jgi:hypothetical protein